MIDQELLKRFDLLNMPKNVQRIRHQKEDINYFLNGLDELTATENVWKIIYIQKPTQPRSLPISIGRGIDEQRGKINVGYLL